MSISRTTQVHPSPVDTPIGPQRSAPTSGGPKKFVSSALSGLFTRPKASASASMAPRSTTSLPKSDSRSASQKSPGRSGGSWMAKATKSVSKVVNKGLHKAGQAFCGLGNILHEPEHEPIYSPYSKAEQEEAAYYGHYVTQETPPSTTPNRQTSVKISRGDSYVPIVTRSMTWEERQAEEARAEQFHEWPNYTVKEPAFKRMQAAARTEARLGLDKSPRKSMHRSMSDSEIELERARADYHHEQPNIGKVVDHEAMEAYSVLQRRNQQLSKPFAENAMGVNMTDLLRAYNVIGITRFKQEDFIDMMVNLTSGTAYAAATKKLIQETDDLGIKLKGRWDALRALQVDARSSNVNARSIRWLMENHTEAFIQYLGSGSKRKTNALLELINS